LGGDVIPDPYLWLVLGVLVAVAALPLLPPAGPTAVDLSPTEVGLLRGGAKAALVTALTALHADGLIEIRRQGGVRRASAAMPAGRDSFERTVYAALHTPAGVRSLATRLAIRRALAVLAGRLADLGLMPGRLSWSVGRMALVAVLAVVVARLVAGDTQRPTFAILTAAALIAGCLWFLPRRTIAGHRVLRALRREHAHRLAAWTAGEHEPHDASLDAKLEHATPAAIGGSAATIAIALGLVSVLVAAGVPVVDFEAGADSLDDASGGDASADDRGYGIVG
jgi:uncharacterized protein (TIGR04222 family)